MQHAKLSPSKSHMWMSCPGSIRMSLGAPTEETQSAAAAEGTEAHELSEHMFLEPDRETFEGFDDDMHFFVRQYVDYVKSHETKTSELFVEVKLDLREFIRDGFGTSDNILVDLANKTLHVFDLKYGKGVKVYAAGNSQGRIYAGGALTAHDKKKEIEKVVIHIGQPRLNHFDSEELTAKELMKYMKTVKKAAKDTEKPDAALVPGEDQCRWCLAKDSCRALKDFMDEAIADQFEDLGSEYLSIDEAADILKKKALIDSFLKAVEERVISALANGEDVPGFDVGISKTNRKWTDDAEEFLIEELGDEAYKKSLIALGVAEKLLGKETVNKYTFRPEGKIIAIKSN